ncbi:MAG: glycosyltransferase family 39 protein [Candidatus Omnitrophica bacterium]|nr:glycosyltransferase family 39 protein [Candidatus Omnitrophota bacterium]
MSRRWGVLILFGIALALRLAAIDWTNRPPTGDGPLYDDIAMNLLSGRGYSDLGQPTAWVMPGYPLFLAGIYAIAGHSYDAVRVVQAALGALNCVLVLWIGRLLWNEPVGWLAGALCAIHPFLILAGTHLLTENLFLCLLVGMILFWVRFAASGRLRDLAGMALLCALATLTRPVLVCFPAFFVVWLLARRRQSRLRPLAALGVFSAVLLIPLGVWAGRNYLVFDQFIPLATESGDAFYDSYHPVDGKVFGRRDDQDPVLQTANRLFPKPCGTQESARSRFLFQKGLQSIWGHPAQVPRLLFLKAATFWSVFDWEILGEGRYNLGTAVLLPWAVVGLWFWWTQRRRVDLGFVALPILYIFAMGLVFYGLPRFRLTVEPLLALLAGVGLWWAWQRAAAHAVLVGGLAAWVGVNLTALRYSDAVKGSCRLVLERMGLW